MTDLYNKLTNYGYRISRDELRILQIVAQDLQNNPDICCYPIYITSDKIYYCRRPCRHNMTYCQYHSDNIIYNDYQYLLLALIRNHMPAKIYTDQSWLTETNTKFDKIMSTVLIELRDAYIEYSKSERDDQDEKLVMERSQDINKRLLQIIDQPSD